jgi:predicted acylesterase/phospholipase RssA
MLGLAAVPLAGCGMGTPKTVTTFSTGYPDPLAAYRLHAEAPAELWSRHIPSRLIGPDTSMLALSGGGEDGAFGAGALNGWSASGQRPVFQLVTGISIGALIAPFAFLGSRHDTTLREVFTQYGSSDFLDLRGLPGLFGDSIYDTSKLFSLIETYTPPELLDAIAVRHDAGARLLVVTSNLDTGQAIVWNMGEIARDGLYDLFRNVMRASSALPGLFPPVTLRFERNGRTLEETHVDGGLHMQFLAVPTAAATAPRRSGQGGHLYVLINNTLNPSPKPVRRSVINISQQALATMIRSSATATITTARLFSQYNGLRLSIGSIDPNSGLVADPRERFSKTYMRALFRHGYDRARDGTLWN